MLGADARKIRFRPPLILRVTGPATTNRTVIQVTGGTLKDLSGPLVLRLERQDLGPVHAGRLEFAGAHVIAWGRRGSWRLGRLPTR
jgi:hypothetical protein